MEGQLLSTHNLLTSNWDPIIQTLKLMPITVGINFWDLLTRQLDDAVDAMIAFAPPDKICTKSAPGNLTSLFSDFNELWTNVVLTNEHFKNRESKSLVHMMNCQKLSIRMCDIMITLTNVMKTANP